MRSALRPYLIIILLAGIWFIPFLGNVHLFDWDEINFAEMAREMIVLDSISALSINYQDFWEKPPLFIWMITLCMKMFGVSEFSARLPNALIGIITLLTLFRIGSYHKDSLFGWIWVGAYFASFLPSLYFRSAIIDPSFNLFMFLGIWYLYRGHRSGKLNKFILSAVFTGLAVLTKGPVGLLMVGGAGFISLILQRADSKVKVVPVFVWIAAFGLTASSWFLYEMVTSGPEFVLEFIKYQIRLLTTEDSGHGGPFFYHFIVVLLGCFPASAFALSYWKRHWKKKAFAQWMLILLGWVLLIFSIVNTKIVHYSSLAYFPISFLAAYTIYRMIEAGAGIKKLSYYVLIALGVIIGIAITLVPFIGMNLDLIIPYVKDPFAVENMKAELSWTWAQSIGGLILLSGVILFVKWSNSNVSRAIASLAISSAICIQWTLISIVPNVEGISQRAAIEFYESLEGEDCYVEVLGFKSYAHLFYTKKPHISKTEALDKEWLLLGDIDKDAYFVTKVHLTAKYKDIPQLTEIRRQNGFVFYKRSVK